MPLPIRSLLCLVSLYTAGLTGLAAQTPAPGLRLYGEITSNSSHLVDTSGAIVHTWNSAYRPALGMQLDADGNLLRPIALNPGSPPSSFGGVQRLAFDSTLLWDYRSPVRTNHDSVPMPNGNVLLVAWEDKTPAEAIAAGRDPALLGTGVFSPNYLIEVRPTGPTSGTIVWEWHVWDHLVQDFDPMAANFGTVAATPGRLDINYPQNLPLAGNFNHVNGIDYDPINDLVAISAAHQNEIWIVDHSTTSAAAAGSTGGRHGKGGDLLYRWGNPAAYRAGTAADQQLFYQHDPRFVPPGFPGAGNLTVFNNRLPNLRSAVYEITPSRDPLGNFVLGSNNRYGPANPVWTYSSPTLYSRIMSSAERLPNGNTLVCSGAQRWLFEVTPSGQRVWEHRGLNQIFQAHYVPRSLWSNAGSISAASGGIVQLHLLAGTALANRLYLVACTASGTSPGTPLPGGATLPLNLDPLLLASLTFPNNPPVFQQTLGVLNPTGGATAGFGLPAGLRLGGLQLHFAFAAFDAGLRLWTTTSNAMPVAITN